MSAWLPVAPCTVAACVSAPRESVGRVRRALRLLGAVAVVLAGLPWALAALRLGDRRRTAMSALWARAFLRALGVRLVVRTRAAVPGVTPVDQAERDGALLVANHVSWLDPLVIAAAVPCRFLAKSEIARWPVIRSLATGGGAIFIDRERLSTLPATVGAVADALRAGRPVAAFPEGTTWCGREAGRFRPAVFQAAIDAGVPVRPVGLRFQDQGGEVATGPAFVGEDTLIDSLRRVIATRELVAEVTLFPLIASGRGGGKEGGGKERRALADLAQAVVSGDLRPRHDRDQDAVAA